MAKIPRCRVLFAASVVCLVVQTAVASTVVVGTCLPHHQSYSTISQAVSSVPGRLNHFRVSRPVSRTGDDHSALDSKGRAEREYEEPNNHRARRRLNQERHIPHQRSNDVFPDPCAGYRVWDR